MDHSSSCQNNMLSQHWVFSVKATGRINIEFSQRKPPEEWCRWCHRLHKAQCHLSTGSTRGIYSDSQRLLQLWSWQTTSSSWFQKAKFVLSLHSDYSLHWYFWQWLLCSQTFHWWYISPALCLALHCVCSVGTPHFIQRYISPALCLFNWDTSLHSNWRPVVFCLKCYCILLELWRKQRMRR